LQPIIKQILENKIIRQKYVIIPKKSELIKGDYVKIEKVEV